MKYWLQSQRARLLINELDLNYFKIKKGHQKIIGNPKFNLLLSFSAVGVFELVENVETT